MVVKLGSLNSPARISSLQQDARPVEANGEELINAGNSLGFELFNDSFKFNPLNYPLQSTQQLNVDWSKFENHTFFSSAEAKVNDAFNLLINSYPFDGSKIEVQKFIDKLTGFEKYVFDQFPSWSGALHFSGTKVGEDTNGTLGTWISVKDNAGYLYPDISKNSTGDVIINPSSTGSLSIETQIYLPAIANGTQVIFQKQSNSTNGFTFYLQSDSSTSYATASFCVTSGSTRVSTSAVLSKGTYNHVCAILNKETYAPDSYLQLYINEKLANSSNKIVSFGKLDIDNSNFLIGTGSSFYNESTLVTPTQTLSGTLDEFRLFHSVRTEEKQKLFATRGIYSTPDLKLYYRFNEPPPLLSSFSLSDAVNSIVLDSSGNSLHSNISNFTGSLRINAATDSKSPIRNEKKEFTIVLFPAYEDVKTFNNNLLTSASLYDDENPNIIVKLIPKHYLLEGAADEGFLNELGNTGQNYGGSGIPGQGVEGSTHLILTFLYIWAKFFDDIKLYVESFGTLRTVDYSLTDTAPDNFLNDIIKSYGFYLPNLFNHTDVSRYTDDSDGIDTDYTTGQAFKSVQAQILRRVIININDFVRSKGTLHSIRSFLRSVGIDPDNSLKIREYGGYTTKMLGSSRNKRLESIAVVDYISSSLALTTPLSSSRTEPGFPLPAGQFVMQGTNRVGTTNASDGLLTSGSWTIDGHYKFPPYKLDKVISAGGNQSLMRLVLTGSDAYAKPGLVANVVATQKDGVLPSTITAYVRPGTSANSPLLTLSLTLSGTGIFDGDRWNVSLGRKRSDEIGSDYLSSSYYLRAGKSNYGEIEELYTTSQFFNEKISTESNSFEVLSSSFNASGSYIAIGSNQSFPTSILHPFLNNTSEAPDKSRETSFYGWASHLRFWSKSFEETEWKEHVRNYKSAGVEDPKTNYNFVTNISGSFNKLRLDTFAKQIDRNADASGQLVFTNFAYNDISMTGSYFGSGSNVVIVGDVESYSYLSPEFDEASTDDKVRIRGLTNSVNLAENPWATFGPAYSNNEAFIKEEPTDDTRLSIEFSLTDALDRDIVNMFSSFDELGDAIGNPEMMFSPDYPNLEVLRDVYFNKLEENLNFRRFLEFYRWFDVSISTFIQQLIPGKTRYKGTNFVVESHMLERHKRESRHSENYVTEQVNPDKSFSVEFSVDLNK